MHPSALTMACTACTLNVSGKTVELLVMPNDITWRWELRFAGGQTLDAGESETRVAAQVAAQRAFEHRIKRAGLVLRGFTGYRWNDAVANDPIRQCLGPEGLPGIGKPRP